MVNKENIDEKKVLEEEGIVYINDKHFKVNQTSPTLDLLNNSIEIATFANVYKNLLTIIDRLQAKMDAILADNTQDIEDVLKIYDNIKRLKEEKQEEIKNLFTTIAKNTDEVLCFYLGSEIFESQAKSLGFIDKIALVKQCSSQNKSMTLLLKKELIK